MRTQFLECDLTLGETIHLFSLEPNHIDDLKSGFDIGMSKEEFNADLASYYGYIPEILTYMNQRRNMILNLLRKPRKHLSL